MKTLLSLALVVLICSCNNSKKEKQAKIEDSSNETTNTTTNSDGTNPAPGEGSISFVINDTTRTYSASVLVQPDKDKVSPGNDNLAIITANSPNETFVLNFVFAPRTGAYPVVGLGLTKGDHVFGGILGGETKITAYKVNLTECTDLGSNNAGGHKWKISGNVDGEVTIDAMDIMKMSPGHPDAIKVSKIQFSNLTYDDNWQELIEEGLKKMKGQ